MTKAPIVYALVRGARHRGLSALLLYADLEKGEGVVIDREPGNLFDGNAIRVLDPEFETHLGYVAKEKAAILAPWLDAGWVYLSRVVRPAKKKRLPGGHLGVFDGSLEIKCTPLEPLLKKVVRKAKAPIKEEV